MEKDEEFIKFVVPKAVLKTLSREIRAVLNSFEKEVGIFMLLYFQGSHTSSIKW